jgi:hypothetical protein
MLFYGFYNESGKKRQAIVGYRIIKEYKNEYAYTEFSFWIFML